MTDLPTRVTLDNDGADADRPPLMPFLHMWTAADGGSRIDLSRMTGFGQKSVGGGAAPQWMRPFPGEVSAVDFAILPLGWVGDWHESPKPQWVIPLRGRWFIETMDGNRVEMGPGDIHFGQDQETTNGKGHRSGQIGDEPCFQIIIQFATSPAAQTRDPFGA
ncbi:hypothetical protein [Sphingomonas sp. S-NIH.Pt15_0812]|uniref:hypothetical protein n=1 Tax=Sphingomonas sp. S-NIH.Pt15_0812 TaxID=1920129 RepID=UPI0019D15DF6|nr:hypothetical protein [Sphingomonas sp. S-NIH.Pt15_0812]